MLENCSVHSFMIKLMAAKSQPFCHCYRDKYVAWPTCVMSTTNQSNTNSLPFLVIGIPDLEALHMWISIPFCFTYIMTLLGNSMVFLTVKLDKNLHESMYYFISMSAVINLIFSTAVVPKMLSVF